MNVEISIETLKGLTIGEIRKLTEESVEAKDDA